MARRPDDKPIPHNKRSIKGSTMRDLKRRRARRRERELLRRAVAA